MRAIHAVLFGLAWIMAGSSPGRAAPSEERPPNIVLIIADDHGFPYFSLMGDETVMTPNLDRLVEGGTAFTIGYNTASVCMPSLSTLLRGTEPYVRRQGWTLPTPTEGAHTLPALLGTQGYRSLQVGKLWNRSYAAAGFTDGTKPPDSKGSPFERAMGGAGGLEVGRTTMAPVYDFLNEAGDRPFFLWFAPAVPHGPWDPPQRYLELYRDRSLDPDALRYFASISWLDDTVGALVDYLDHKGLRRDTLIVYLSDNGQGPFDFEGGPVPEGRRSKSTLFELGFRTPVVFNWPGHVPAGVVRDDLVSTLDMYPTLLDYAGVETPEGLTGIDLREAIERGTPVPRDAIVGRARGRIPGFEPAGLEGAKWKPALAYYARDPRWHYIWYDELDLELLFDLEKDPRERVNVVDEHPAVVRRLRARVEEWRSAPSPVGPAARPAGVSPPREEK